MDGEVPVPDRLVKVCHRIALEHRCIVHEQGQ